MFKIEIKNLATKARIGISEKERKKFQPLLVTLQFSYTVKKNDQLNDIQHLKDYSAITKYLKFYIEHSTFKTLEKLFEISGFIVLTFPKIILPVDPSIVITSPSLTS